MVCRLCGTNRPLIKAHIIPESFWPLNSDSRGPMAIVGSEHAGRAIPSRLGPYDPGILCGTCDSEVLNSFDQHAAEALLQGSPIPLPQSNDFMCYPDAEPLLLHGFAASVAWRASITSNEFFSRVRLGAYQNTCRLSFTGDRNAQSNLQILVVEFDKHDVPITDPYHTHIGTVEFLVIQAARFQFWLKIDPQPLVNDLCRFVLTENRPVVSIVRSWRDSKQRKGLQEFFKDEPRPKFWKK